MKHFLLLLFIVSCISVVRAQETIKVTQQQKKMSQGLQNGYVTDVPQALLKDVVNAWKKYIKRGEAASSVDKNGDEYLVTGTLLEGISPKPLTVYATLKEVDNGIRITAFFVEANAAFLSAAGDGEKSAAAEKLMADFARAQYRQAVETELANETIRLSNMEEVYEDLIKANEQSNKDIKEYERKIERAKKDIEMNEHDQDKQRGEIKNQREVVRSVTPKSEAEEAESKKLGKLEKELKKLEKKGEDLHKDIDDWNDDISQEKRNIEKGEEKIKEKKDAIAKQKDHLKEVKEKMENIK